MRGIILTLLLISFNGLAYGQLMLNNANKFPQLKLIADKLNSVTYYQADCDLVISGGIHSVSTLNSYKVPTDTLCGFYYFFKTHEQYRKDGGDFTAFFNNSFYMSINNSINKINFSDEPERFKVIKFANGYYPAIHRASFYLKVIPKEVSKYIYESLTNMEMSIIQKPDTLLSGNKCIRYIINANHLALSPYTELCFDKNSYAPVWYKESSGGFKPQYIMATLSNTKIDQPLAANYFSEMNLFGRRLTNNTKEIKTLKYRVGEAVPDWELPILGQKGNCSSKKMRGKYVLLEFTGTWCSHCREAVRMMNSLEDKFKGNKKLSILSVFSTDNDYPEKILRFANDQKIKSTILYSATKVGDKYGIIGYPTFLIINPDGKLGLAIVGYSEGVEDQIINYLKNKI
jgi:thiol-disulfide isomerase/thioredoxin